MVLVDKNTGVWFDAGDTRIIAVPDDEEAYWNLMPDVGEQLREAERNGVRVELNEGEDLEGYVPLSELADFDLEYLAVDLSSGSSFEHPENLALLDTNELPQQLENLEPSMVAKLASDSTLSAVVSDDVIGLI